MFKFKNIYLTPLLLFLLFLIFPRTDINAAKIKVGDYTLDNVSVVEDDLYISADTVVIEGVVDGDLFVGAENVTVGGTVTGDVYLFGTNVYVNGNIYGNTVVGGSTVNITGTHKGNVYVGAATANLDGTFNKDVLVLSGTLNLDGTVGDDVRVLSAQVISTASVGDDFLISSDNYSVNEDDIHGELVAPSDSVLTDRDTDDFIFTKKDLLGFNLGLAVVNFIGMYIVGLILILSAPVKTLQYEQKIIKSWEEFLKSYAVGLVILFTVPIPLFLLVLTLVGAPLAVLITGILLFLSIFGTIWVESAIGQKVLLLGNKTDSSRLLSLLVGRAISTVVKLIPILRGIYSFSLIFVVVGAVARSKYDAFVKSKEASKKKTK